MQNLLVVGQGLAGSAIVRELLRREINFKIISDYKHNTSSMVAAGLYNPVTFKRLKTTWSASKLSKNLEDHYVVEGKSYTSKRVFARIIGNVEEENNWIEKANSPLLSQFLDENILHETIDYINSPYGFGLVKQAGFLNIPDYIKTVKELLQKKELLWEGSFQIDQLQEIEDQWLYNEESFNHVVFCQGYETVKNLYFNWLPIKHMKGEIITIKSQELNLNYLLNKGIFILPLGNNIYKIGATYDRNDASLSPTSSAKDELISKFKEVCSAKFEVINHQAGIRPAVIDRRPILGPHPEKKGLWIFNGLGSKGVMLSHYFAQQLVECILENTPLSNEVAIDRFYKKYYEKN